MKGGQIAPNGIEFVVGDRCASFDGDADRIVYFCKNSGELQPFVCVICSKSSLLGAHHIGLLL